MKAVIIDDEADGREAIRLLLKHVAPEVEVSHEADSAAGGKEAILRYNPDVVFLDIEMPGKNGIDMLKELDEISFSVIFITAYNRYALEALKAGALDYLLKPVDPEELALAIRKVKMHEQEKSSQQLDGLVSLINNSMEALSKSAPANDSIFVKYKNRIVKIKLTDISVVEAYDNYTYIQTTDSFRVLVPHTLKDTEALLAQKEPFVRVHRSYLVNMSKIEAIEDDCIHLGDLRIPIGKTYKEELFRKIRMI